MNLRAILANPLISQATFFGAEEDETFTHTDLAGAVADAIDGADISAVFVDIACAKPMDTEGHLDAGQVLEYLEEILDEELGDPENFGETLWNPEVNAAAEAFLRLVEKSYTPWACEIICVLRINIEEWEDAHNTGSLTILGVKRPPPED